MVKTLYGRIITLPSRTPNGDYVPGVIEANLIRGSNEERGDTRYPPLYGFYPDHLGDELGEQFTKGKLSTPKAVSFTVDSLPRQYVTLKKKSIFVNDS